MSNSSDESGTSPEADWPSTRYPTGRGYELSSPEPFTAENLPDLGIARRVEQSPRLSNPAANILPGFRRRRNNYQRERGHDSRRGTPEPVDDNNRWTTQLEVMAEGLASRAEQEAWMYSWMAISGKRWGNILLIISGLMSGVVGVEGLVLLIGDHDPGLSTRITITILSIIGLIAVTMNGVWSPIETGASASQTEIKLLGVQRSIHLQLALHVRRRQKGDKFMKSVIEDHHAALLGAPIPTSDALQATEKRYGSQFSIPGGARSKQTAARIAARTAARTAAQPPVYEFIRVATPGQPNRADIARRILMTGASAAGVRPETLSAPDICRLQAESEPEWAQMGSGPEEIIIDVDEDITEQVVGIIPAAEENRYSQEAYRTLREQFRSAISCRDGRPPMVLPPSEDQIAALLTNIREADCIKGASQKEQHRPPFPA